MKEELISYNTSKLAKERGYNWSSNYTYDSEGNLEGLEYIDSPYFTEEHIRFAKENGFDSCLAPTQSLLQKWLRDVHGIHVCTDINIQSKWYFSLFNLYSKRNAEFPEYNNSISCNTYEEALEAGLVEGLKLIK